MIDTMLELPEGAQILSFTRDKLHELWETVREYPSTFADGTKDPEQFIARLLARDSVVIELEGGIILFENIQPGMKAEFHATFWDHKLSARTDILKEILIWAFLTFGLERLETYVAVYARAVRRFLTERLGFIYEGTLRNGFRNQGDLHDLEIYSILKEEVL